MGWIRLDVDGWMLPSERRVNENDDEWRVR